MSEVGKRRRNSISKKFKAAAAAAKALEGKTQLEIAKELGMSRQGVSKLFSSVETKEILAQAESQVVGMIGKAVGVVERAMDNADNPEAMTHGLKAALEVLHSVGVFKKKVDLSHAFPRPVVIDYGNGEKSVMGSGDLAEDDE